MKKIILLIICVCFVFAGYSQVPAADVKTSEGKKVNTRDLIEADEVTVVIFWSTSSGTSKNFLNIFNKEIEDYEEAKVVAVSVDNTITSPKVMPYVRGNGWSYTILLDERQDFMRAMNCQTLPSVYIFNKSKKLVYSHTGYQPGYETELMDKIKTIEVAGQ